MTRAGLWTALGLAAIVGVVFGLYPRLDLVVAGLFHVPEESFPLNANTALGVVRHGSMVVVALLVAPAILALVLKLVRPQRPMRVPGRAAVFLVSSLLLGPLLTANLLLKEYWGRPRPRDVVTFGGTEPFRPWWDPRGGCESNCSFIAGEVSGATWTVAPAALAPPQWRTLAYAGALTFIATVGLLRMAFGGHFFTDVVFAGVLTFLIIWLLHGFLYRWRRTRTSDTAIEAALADIGVWLRRRVGGAGKPAPTGRGPDKRVDRGATASESDSQV